MYWTARNIAPQRLIVIEDTVKDDTVDSMLLQLDHCLTMKIK